jgi:hypothetical protein
MAVDALYALRIRVYRGSDLPYFIKGQVMQPGEALAFIQRHVNRASHIEGV